MEKENWLSSLTLDICFNIHRQYGPGLFEKVYEEILCYEFEKSGIRFERQKSIPLVHDSVRMGAGFRADIILESALLIEIKSVECLSPIHYKQVQTYLKLSKIKLGLLVNFNEVRLKDGIKRIIWTY